MAWSHQTAVELFWKRPSEESVTGRKSRCSTSVPTTQAHQENTVVAEKTVACPSPGSNPILEAKSCHLSLGGER